MDPNATLAHLREMVGAVLDNADESTSDYLVELCQAFDDLDSWLTSPRGFLPQPWQGS